MPTQRFYVELSAVTYADTPEQAVEHVLESFQNGKADCTVSVTDEKDSHVLETHT